MTKSKNRKLIRVTLSNECLKHMCVDLGDYNIYLNQIWYRTQYHTINTPEWPNSHKLKIQDGISEKNVNNCGLDKDILHQIIWEDAPWPCGDDHVTKIRYRKLIRETSSNEHKCVDLSDSRRYLKQILYSGEAPPY